MYNKKVEKILIIVPNAWILFVILSYYLKITDANLQGLVEMTMIPAVLIQFVMSILIIVSWIDKKSNFHWLYILNLLLSVYLILSFSGVVK